MICPFCEGRNTPGSVICSHCGAILRGATVTKRHTRQQVREARQKRDRVVLIGLIVVAFFLGAALGGSAAYLAPHRPLILGAVAGAMLGALLAAVAGGGKALYLANRYRARFAVLQSRVNSALATAGEGYEEELKKPAANMQIRLHLAAWHLLKDEEDKALQVLQTAQRLGASGLEFDNNAGVALARRGSLAQSQEMFQRAATAEAPTQPYANLAHVYTDLLADPEAVEKAMVSVRDALTRSAKNPTLYDRLGTIFFRDGRMGEAGTQFQQALSLASGSQAAEADARNNLGVLRQTEGTTREGGREFAAALSLVPGHACALANQGLHQILLGEAEAGLEKVQNAAHLDPRNAGAHNTLGYALCRIGDANGGIRACREALTLNPNLFEPCANLGKAYADAGLPDVAEHYLSRAAQIQPRSWEVMLTTGVVKLALEQPAQAATCFESGLQLNPQHPSLLMGMAVACALTGRVAEAKRRLEQAERYDKGNPDIHGLLGWLNLREDSASDAQAETEIALAKRPKDALLQNNLGLAQIGLGAYEVSLETLRRANRLDPNLNPVYYHLGAVYALLKQPDPAIKAWEIAAKHEPANPDCFANLGAAFYRKSEYDPAVSNFRHVLQIRQDRPEDYSNLGLSYAKQGVTLKRSADSVSKATALIGLGAVEEKLKQALQKQKQAIEMFDRALELDPRNVIVHSNRGLACFFANRPEEAMEEWANVTKLDPLYARKRGKAQQTEFDDSQVDYVPINVPERAMRLPLKTADYLPHFLWGYDMSEWEMIVSDPALASLPAQISELRALERTQRAIQL